MVQTPNCGRSTLCLRSSHDPTGAVHGMAVYWGMVRQRRSAHLWEPLFPPDVGVGLQEEAAARRLPSQGAHWLWHLRRRNSGRLRSWRDSPVSRGLGQLTPKLRHQLSNTG